MIRVLDDGLLNDDDLNRYAQEAYEYYVSVREWRQYEGRRDSIQRELELNRNNFVADRLKEWDQNKALEVEEAKWGWHPLFRFCTKNPVVAAKMPELPWAHTREEAEMIACKLQTSRTPPGTAPPEARLLRIFMLSNNIPCRSVRTLKRTLFHLIRLAFVPSHRTSCGY